MPLFSRTFSLVTDSPDRMILKPNVWLERIALFAFMAGVFGWSISFTNIARELIELRG